MRLLVQIFHWRITPALNRHVAITTLSIINAQIFSMRITKRFYHPYIFSMMLHKAWVESNNSRKETLQ